MQIPERYPDPGVLVNRDSEIRLPERCGDNEAEWRAVVTLLHRALRTGGEARERAAIRLGPVARQGILTNAETSELADALWAAENVATGYLPTNTTLYDWAFLLLPEPETGLAARRFRRKWLSRDVVQSRHDLSRSGGTIRVEFGSSPDDPAKLEDRLWYLGNAVAASRAHGGSLDLTDVERDRVVDLVSQWANSPVNNHPYDLIRSQMQRYLRWGLEGLVPILSRNEIPEPVGEALFQKFKELTESGTPAFGPIGGLVRVLPHRVAELAAWLRTGLASGSRDMASVALSGLSSWIQMSNSSDLSVHSPPEDILREVGVIIAARRKESLSAALQIAKQVFDDGNDDQRDVILNFTLDGLEYLAEELRYDTENDDIDVPNLRWRCTQLASSMSNAGFSCRPAVVRWLELAPTDPFPEIRNAPLDDLREPSLKDTLQHK